MTQFVDVLTWLQDGYMKTDVVEGERRWVWELRSKEEIAPSLRARMNG